MMVHWCMIVINRPCLWMLPHDGALVHDGAVVTLWCVMVHGCMTVHCCNHNGVQYLSGRYLCQLVERAVVYGNMQHCCVLTNCQVNMALRNETNAPRYGAISEFQRWSMCMPNNDSYQLLDLARNQCYIVHARFICPKLMSAATFECECPHQCRE